MAGSIGKLEEFVSWNIPPHCSSTSPYFEFDGKVWRLTRYDKRYDNALWEVLTLKNFSDPDTSISVKLGFKGEVGNIERNAVPTDLGREFTAKVIQSSDLTKEMFYPRGELTVLCKIVTEGTRNEINGAEENRASKSIEKLHSDLKEMYLSGQGSDVVLRVGRRNFKAHRTILAARSPVFSAMFTHSMTESLSGVVAIKDNDSNTFSDFLHYLYTGRVEKMTSENVLKLYVTADKYQVPALKEECLDFMISNITEETICDFLNLALRHREKELVAAANSFLSEQKKSL